MNRREVARSLPDNQSIATKNHADSKRGLESPFRGTEMGVRSVQ